ncbi:MAG: cell surface protein SprA [Calditrichales bacterium]|nr:MAG: cell surface protein SprA [Calditrichales bacterium]
MASLFMDSTLFKIKPPLYKRAVTLDSSATFVTASEVVAQTEFDFPVIADLDTYIRLRLAFDRREIWKKAIREKIEKSEELDSGALELEIPVRIKNETFTRIFGSDRVRLRVTGNISFDLSGRSEERSGAKVSAMQDRGSFSPRFSQTQQFTIEGKIGEKVTVSVEQNSEATFDFENTLKLRYEGDEDEIIQSIEAGNISLSLPSTKYVIFGGSNKGLFGIRSDMKVGNFYFTGIASIEKGEQKKLTISGNSEESKTVVHDYDFVKNKYFFMDEYYRTRFEEGFSEDLTTWSYEEGTLIKEFNVFKSGSYANNEARKGVATIPSRMAEFEGLGNLEGINAESGEVEIAEFIPLEEGKDYEYDYARGFFWLKQTVKDVEVLAIAYKTDRKKVGTLFSEVVGADSTKPYVLRLIKPKSLRPDHTHVWPLMMQNVYFLGGTDIEQEGFNIQVEYNKDNSHETIQQVDPRKSFLYLMGLDRLDENGGLIPDGDKLVDNNTYLINRADGVLMFPSVVPFDPLAESRFVLADTNRVRMYNITDRTAQIDKTKFEIVVSSRSTRSSFSLGFNVLEGSEEVMLNGAPLARNVDYIIDYFTGQLTLISTKAKRASSDIEIKYEKASVFQLDKKTILGGRGEYRFWDDSFIGFTALYMSKSTLEQRVRVGQEPFSNFVWDINTALNFQPEFLTDFINILTFSETNQPSTLKLEAEFAQVLPNPNTLDNDKTGDTDGVAYIDDFEGTKRSTTLGIRYNTWTRSSPPKILPMFGRGAIIDTVADKSRGKIVWYNPYDQELIKNIWPNRDVNAETGQTTDVLGVEVWREADQDPNQAWAGIMRSTASFPNQQKTKYIELWVKEDTVSNSEYVRMNIDVGQISEDWYMQTEKGGRRVYGAPDWRGLNTEDKNRNGILDEEEDTGIDGIVFGQPGYDPDDLWREPNRSTRDYTGINGTEGNSRAQAANYPDSEDLDGNGQVDLLNEYFHYSFTLDPKDEKSKKWISGSTSSGWKQLRIPLPEYDRQNSVGSPDTTFQSVYYVRLWFSNLTEKRKEIRIATLDFVGNEWEEEGIAENDSSTFIRSDSLFSITVYNSEENAVALPGGPDPYVSPPGVSGVRDRITKAMSKEQSMVLRMRDLPGGAVARAKKTLYGDIMQLVNYKRLRMFVYGEMDVLPRSPDDMKSPINIYLRFGADDNNYYEYTQEVYAGWSRNNEVDIDLDELTRTKFVESGMIQVPDRPGGYYKVKGNPSMNTIRYFRVGIKNNDIFSWSGEIWLDEMRLSGVRQDAGSALRLGANLRVADVFTFNGGWESKDADFHDIKTQFGSGNSVESQNYSGVLNVDRLLPPSLDISLPVDARASFNKNIPKYFPKTDILTNYRNETISDKIKSLFGMKNLPPELERQVAASETYGIGTTVKKKSSSDAWYLYYTIDQLTVDFDYSLKRSRDYQTAFRRSEQWQYNFSFGIPYGSTNFVEPFKILEKFPILSELSDQKIYYTPNNTSFSLNVTDQNQANRLWSEANITRTVNRGSTRRASLGYRLVPSLNFSLTRTHQADADFINRSGKEMWQAIFTKLDFGIDTDINQNFKFEYKPKIFDWLDSDYAYSADFRYYFVNLSKGQKQSANKISRKVSLGFNPSQLISKIYTPESKGGDQPARSGQPRRPTRNRSSSKVEPDETKDTKDTTETDETKNETKQEGEDQKAGFTMPNPLMLVYEFFNSWKKIQTTYSWNENVTNSYVSEIPSWKYQFGLTSDPGAALDSTFGNILVGPSLTDSRSLRSSISLDFSKNIRATLDHEYSVSESRNDKSSSGNVSSTFLAWGEDPTENFEGLEADVRRFIPDWTIKITGIEEFLFFKDIAKSVSIEHSRTGKYTNTKTLANDELVPSAESFAHNFQPLIGVNITWFGDVRSSVRLTQGATFNFKSAGGATRSETNSFSISGSYATSGGFQIPIPIWPFKGATFKNEINFSLTYDRSVNKTFQKQINQASFQENQNNTSWKLRPSATYRFNKRVSGSLYYETGVTENKISGKFSWNEFGVTVNIAIRD